MVFYQCFDLHLFRCFWARATLGADLTYYPITGVSYPPKRDTAAALGQHHSSPWDGIISRQQIHSFSVQLYKLPIPQPGYRGSVVPGDFSMSLSSQPPTSTLQPSRFLVCSFSPYRFAFSGMLYKWDHTISSFLNLSVMLLRSISACGCV